MCEHVLFGAGTALIVADRTDGIACGFGGIRRECFVPCEVRGGILKGCDAQVRCPVRDGVCVLVTVTSQRSIWSMLIGVLISTVAGAGVIHVPEDTISVQRAIDTARAGDVVDIGPGVWREAIDLKGKSILLKGRDGAAKTVLDATGLSGSVITCVSGEGPGTVIEGLTISGGTGSKELAGDESRVGGGLFAMHSSPTFRGCIFRGNAVKLNGGGAYCGPHANVRFERCQFVGNVAVKGGAILCVKSSPVIEGCTFDENQALYSGGGVHVDFKSKPVIRDSVFRSNHAAYQGGAIYSTDSGGEVLDSTFERNRSGGDGGALYLGFRTQMRASACVYESPTDTVGGRGQFTRQEHRYGGCALGGGLCIIAEEEDCLAAGGAFQGRGSVCPQQSETDVARQSGDLNRDGEINRRDAALMLLLWR